MDLPLSSTLLTWVLLVGISGLCYITADSSEEGRPFPPFAPFSPFGFPLAPVPFIGRAPPLPPLRIAPPPPLPLLPAAPPLVVPIQPIALSARLVGPPLPFPDGVVPFPAGFDSSGSASFESGSFESSSGSGSFEGVPVVAGVPSQPLQIVPVSIIHEPKQYVYEATTVSAPYIAAAYKEEPAKPYEYKPEVAKIVLQPVVHKKKPKKYGGYDSKPVKTEKLTESPAEEGGSSVEQPLPIRPSAPSLSSGSVEQPAGAPRGPEVPQPVVLPGPPPKTQPDQRLIPPPSGPPEKLEAQPEVTSSVTQIKVEVKNVPRPPSPQGRLDDGNVSVEDNRPPMKKAYPEGKYDRTEAYPQRYAVPEAPRPYGRAYEVEEYGESEGYRGAANYPGYTNSRDLRPRPLF